MGTSTVAYVEIENPDVLKILTLVNNALEEMGATNIQYTDLRGFFTVIFDHANDNARMMFVNFHADSDYTDNPVKKVVFSLGYWGSSEHIISRICTWMNLAGIGNVYYHAKDTEGDFIKFNGGL